MKIDSHQHFWIYNPVEYGWISNDMEILKRRFYAQIEFTGWICNKAIENGIHIEIMILKKLLTDWFFRGVKDKIKFLSFGLIARPLSKLYLNLYEQKPLKQKFLLLYIYKIYRFLIGIIKNMLFWEDFKLHKLK